MFILNTNKELNSLILNTVWVMKGTDFKTDSMQVVMECSIGVLVLNDTYRDYIGYIKIVNSAN